MVQLFPCRATRSRTWAVIVSIRSASALDFVGQLGVLAQQRLDALGQHGVLAEHVDQQRRLLLHLLLALLGDPVQLLAVLRRRRSNAPCRGRPGASAASRMSGAA